MRQGLLYAKLTMTAIFWGGTFVAGRVIAQQLPPFSAAFLRFAVAAVALLLALWKVHGCLPRVSGSQILPLWLLGLTGIFAYNGFFFAGLKTVSASRASLIIANNPVMIALCSAIFFRERLDALRIGGILLSLWGATLVISRGHPMALLLAGGWGQGEIYILGCVASWVLYSLLGKVALRQLPPLVVVTYACLAGLALLLPFALAEGVWTNVSTCSPEAWGGIVYLGVCGSALAFIWYYQGIQRIGPTRAGVFINLVPVSGVLLAFLLLQERLDRSLWMGAVLVLSGVFLTNRQSLARRT